MSSDNELQIPGNGGGLARSGSIPKNSAPDRNNPGDEPGGEARRILTPIERAPLPTPSRRTRKPKAGRIGQLERDTHRYRADADSIGSGEIPGTGDHGGRFEFETHMKDAPVIAGLVELTRVRAQWMKARNRLINQGKAVCRNFVGGDKVAAARLYNRIAAGSEQDPKVVFAVMPYAVAAGSLEAQMTEVEKSMVRLARQLPIYPWAREIRGFGDLSLAIIVGACGDVGSYKSVSAVWKRMGLAVINGQRQRKVEGVDALEHGYSPKRRAMMWVIADTMTKHQRQWTDKETGEVTKEAGPYGIYLEAEKAKQIEKGIRPFIAEKRAKRHMSKRLLRDLWVAWRGCGQSSYENQGSVAAPHPIAA